jgi:hypothetical protein
MSRQTNIQILRGSSATWIDINPILNSGEPGFDSTNNILKIGNGTSNWSTLPVANSALTILNVDNLRLDGNTIDATNTNGNLIIAPNGTGALIASSTGDARGSNAVDLQTSISSNSQVASGSYSTIIGGQNNAAGGDYSTVGGGYFAKASRYGEAAHASGRFSQAGDAQHSIFLARNNTTNATPTELFLDGSSIRMILTPQTTWTFSIKLSAYNDSDNTGAWWIIRGGIRRNHANGTSLVGSLIEENGGEGTMDTTSVSVSADDTNESLKIEVTGLASKNIRWVAVVDVSQVSWGTP